MGKIAFISENGLVYCSPLIIGLAAVAAILVYLGLLLRKEGSGLGAAFSVLLSVLISIPLARLIHWYCQSGAYTGFWAAMTDYSSGQYALAGVFAGCMLGAVLTRLLGLHKDLPGMLDCMSLAGCVGIGLGRLSALFNSTDRAIMVVSEDVGFPFAYLLENPVTGEVENRIATFMLQSFAAWGILAALVGYMLWRRGKRIPGGHIALLFTLCYCASQIVLDSTRYDALVLRSNGFVSMVQILGCVGLLVPVVIFSGIYLRAGCKKGVGAAVWAAMACMLGLAGYMEYFVQNTREKAFLAYGIMTLAMGIVVALTLLLRKMTMDKLEAALSAADTND